MAQIDLQSLRRMGLLGERITPATGEPPGQREGQPGGQRGGQRARARERIASLKAVPNGGSSRCFGDLVVERLPLSQCAMHVAAWRGLARRAIEPNIFFEPAFALTAHQHLVEAEGLQAVIVWQRQTRDGPGQADGYPDLASRPSGTSGRMIGLWLCHPPRRALPLPFAPVAQRGFSCRFSASGAPLLDRTLAVEAASALLRFLFEHDDAPTAVILSQLAVDGGAARALRAACLLNALDNRITGLHARACVQGKDGSLDSATSSKSRKESARLMRRLTEKGVPSLTTARSDRALRDSFELFLAQEASGWKGRRGTAIVQNTRDQAFFRSLLRQLGREGEASVHALYCDSRMAAAGVIVHSGGHGWFLKTSHDEALRAFQPGFLLSVTLAARMRATDTETAHAAGHGADPISLLDQLDSCAFAGHEMIERAWQGRLRVGDLMLGLPARLPAAARIEVGRQTARSMVKQVWLRLRRAVARRR